MEIQYKTIQELERLLQKVEKEYKEEELTENVKKILENYHGEDEVIDIYKAREEFLKENKIEKVMPSKIPTLDNFLGGGFRKGNLITISAPTDSGKTVFAQTLTKNFSENEIFSLWFSYEVPQREFIERFNQETLPCCCIPKNLINNDMIWVERKIVEAIVKYNIKIVFIDHLHYLLKMNGKDNVSFAVGEIMRSLKKIALKYKIIIFLIAHITKTRPEVVITISDLRDSSFIAQESDIVLMLWRKTKEKSNYEKYNEGITYLDEAVLLIEKNRFNGKKGSITLLHKDKCFYELLNNQIYEKSIIEEVNL